MAVNYKVYKNNRKGNNNGQYYARAAYRETVTIKDLAARMQSNCTVKYSDIMAVLTEFAEVLKEELQRSNRVKIDGLGTFKVGLTTTGAPSAKEFTAANIKGAHILFQPEAAKDGSTGKRVKPLLAGVKFKEADSYKSLKEEDNGTEETLVAPQE